MTDIDREIMLAILAGEAGELERRLHQTRLDSDAEYAEEFERIQWLWSECEGVAPLLVGGSSPPDPESIVAMVEEAAGKRDEHIPRARVVAPTRKGAWRLPAAAACLVALTALAVLASARRQVTADFGPTVILTEADEIVVVTLEDGTVVRLAPSSRLAFGDGRGRSVELDGRAYFAVTHREGDPFQVHLPQRTITVLGTRFDVEARDGRVKVAVVEGEVRVSDDVATVTARADQVAYGPDSGALVLQDVEDVFQTVDWLGPFLAFESTPLDKVVEELERRFELQIVVAEDFPPSTVTGWFSDQTAEGIVAAICTAVGARCIMSGSAVRMERSGGNRWAPEPAPVSSVPPTDVAVQGGG